MATDKIISGIVRGVLPYAALAAVGIVGYSYLNRHGYLDGVKSAADAAANIPSQLVNTIRSRTGADKFADGDYIGGAQQIVRNIPIVAAGEAAYNAAADGVKKILNDGYTTTTKSGSDLPAGSEPQLGTFGEIAAKSIQRNPWMAEAMPAAIRAKYGL